MKNFIISLFTILLIFSCKNEPQQVVKIEGKLLPINQEIESVKEIEDFIEPYKQKVAAEMNTILTYTEIDLVRTDGPLESTLGNLMADLCYERANPVFNSRTNKNIDLTISSAKPPIFWKEKEITKQQIQKWKSKNIKQLIYALSEIELQIKKNINNSINLITDFILSHSSAKTNN